MSSMEETYLETLNALTRMRQLCNGQLSLPHMCVVGDQTSGKSSLLQCLTDIEFPVKSGICTRAPIVVQCSRQQKSKLEIRTGPSSTFEEIAKDGVAAAITKAQRCLLGDTNAKVSDKEITLRVHSTL